MTIEWKSNLSVGDRQIDDDHKRLFQIINDYEKAIKLKNIQELKRVFEDLVSYADEHFAREEKIMFKKNYPFAEAHVRHHADLREELKSFHQGLVVEKKFKPAEASAFLKTWLIDHIIAEDLSFKKHLDKQKA